MTLRIPARGKEIMVSCQEVIGCTITHNRRERNAAQVKEPVHAPQ